MKLLLIAVLSSILFGCQNARFSRYTVISRTNPDSELSRVPVVLEHGGHRYYAQCTNIKSVSDPQRTTHCELHVGATIECQFFSDRDTTGYDLICGSKRNPQTGNLDTYGENELLTIDREE